jgi:excisionase family DNA binding protein
VGKFIPVEPEKWAEMVKAMAENARLKAEVERLTAELKQSRRVSNGSSPLLNQKELAEILSVHDITVCRWTVAGKIPCHRIGRIIRYDLAAVMAAIEKKGQP